MSDQHAALKQINEHVKALEVDIQSAEAAGARKDFIQGARAGLQQAHAFMCWAVGRAPDGRTLEEYDKDQATMGGSKGTAV